MGIVARKDNEELKRSWAWATHEDEVARAGCRIGQRPIHLTRVAGIAFLAARHVDAP